MEISELQKHLYDWRDKVGLGNIKDDIWYNIPILMEEVGELCEVITKENGNIEEETADVIIMAVTVANLYDFNLEDAIIRKLKILDRRKLKRFVSHSRVMGNKYIGD